MESIFLSSLILNQLALTILRIGIGILFIGHGFLKIKRGIPELRWTGEQMKNIGITFAPLFWGICAMLAEFGGGVCLALGFCTRLAMPFMIFTMFVAITYHLRKGDSYGYYSFPMSQMLIFIAFLIAGSGPFSLDHFLFG
jgi:putative oxidoreductase